MGHLTFQGAGLSQVEREALMYVWGQEGREVSVWPEHMGRGCVCRNQVEGLQFELNGWGFVLWTVGSYGR